MNWHLEHRDVDILVGMLLLYTGWRIFNDPWEFWFRTHGWAIGTTFGSHTPTFWKSRLFGFLVIVAGYLFILHRL